MTRPTAATRRAVILAGLADNKAVLLRQRTGQWQLEPRPISQTTSAARALSRIAEQMLDEGLIMLAAGGRARLTDAGRLALRPSTDPDHASQHRLLVAQRQEDGSMARLNLAESPLKWLAARKDATGRAYLSPQQVEAGERLRQDFTLAGLTPHVSARWGAPLERNGSAGQGLGYSDTVIAARQRLHRACAAVGPEMSGFLLDICGFLKGLQEAEAARGWPARTGKVILQMALSHLARHYGLAGEARGPETSPMRHWGAADYRPVADLSGSQHGIAPDALDHGAKPV